MQNTTIQPNRLLKEKSPYLLQHAYNPVDWYPWGEEAFAKSKSENKPIFLSIGYSTCHWCHVMAHESFEDHSIARILNDGFVSIKVDREERPDLDAVYMSVCQMLTSSGGWPLTILMTADQNPFWAGTYLPKEDRYGITGLKTLLVEIMRQWEHSQEKLLAIGRKITSLLQNQESRVGLNEIGEETGEEPGKYLEEESGEKLGKELGEGSGKESREESGKESREKPGKKLGKDTREPDVRIFHQAYMQFEKSYDHQWGGFGHSPKFPTPHNILFLLRYHALNGSAAGMAMAEHTLKAMFQGGIFDHVGGGFSRYSTDEKWLVPHFEKMLYDNALLAYVYLEAFEITRNPFYQDVCERILHYVSETLTDKDGGFYCGEDADSDGVEGKYYVFTAAELDKVLGKEDSIIFKKWYHVTVEGNFEGKNILHVIPDDRYPKSQELDGSFGNADEKQLENRISLLGKKLHEYRKTRTRLHKDDKILTSWNALMIAAYAKAARVFTNPKYQKYAERSLEFIYKNLTDTKGRLLIRYREGEAANKGQLDDYAFTIFGMLELYQATFNADYLHKSIRMAEEMIRLFYDKENDGFYLYANDAEQLITRPKELYDGAMPSGNSVAAYVLVRLFKLTGVLQWKYYADRQLAFIAGRTSGYPMGHSFSMLAMMEVLYPSKELICVTAKQEIPDELFELLLEIPLHNLSVLVKTGINEDLLTELAPFTKDYIVPEGETRYYLCKNGACEAPMRSIREVKESLLKVTP